MQGHYSSDNRSLRGDAARHGVPTLDISGTPHLTIPRNGRYGSSGKPIEVLVNCYTTALDLPKHIYHYDLSFTKLAAEGRREYGRNRGRGRGRGRGGRERRSDPAPDAKPPSLPVCTKLIQGIQETYAQRLKNAKIAHDGQKNVYLSTDPGWGFSTFMMDREDIKYEVTFKLVSKVSMQELKAYLRKETPFIPQGAVACLDVVLRTNPLRTMVYTGRAFALAPSGGAAEDLRLGEGCEAWCCFYQTFKPLDTGICLQFDVTYSAFYTQQTVYNFAVALMGPPGVTAMQDVNAFPGGLTSRQISRLNNELRGIRVQSTLQPVGSRPRPQVIKRVSDRPASELEFEHDGRRMSVAEYFVGIKEPLTFPNLPCVDTQSGKKGHTFIPIEMAMICPGQRRRRQMPLPMQGKFIRAGARSPMLRSQDISDMMKIIDIEGDQLLKAFGIKATTVPVKVQARILPPPAILFKEERLDLSDVPRHEMAWSTNQQKLLRIKGDIDPWGVLVIADMAKSDVLKFIRAMMYVAEDAGMTMKMPRIEMGHPPLVANGLVALRENINSDADNKGKLCKIILVIKNDTSTRDYNIIKNVSDTYLGIPTQCVVRAHAADPKELYCRNVLLKMNAKLGGTNWKIERKSFECLKELPYMIIGISISHAPPAESRGDAASVAAAVGSIDPEYSTHTGVFRLQSATSECIDDAGSMVAQLVRQFHSHWGCLPKTLIVYREGCSEGQFQIVMTNEVAAIKKECAKVGENVGHANYHPKITFIVLQKSHRTRFIPTEDGPKDTSGNCVPGMVVDRTVAHSLNYDFFLLSHNAVQGTSRPVRYTLLKDENGFEPDQIQTLTYHLCFCFARATNSVSIVTSVYYAELLAVRGRVYLSARNSNNRFNPPHHLQQSNALPAHITEGTPIVQPDLQKILFYV